MSDPKKRNALSLAMLKSLQSDLLHEAESKDLKVIIISGIYLISNLSALQYPEEVSQNSLVIWGVPSLNGVIVFEAPFKNVDYGKLMCSGGLDPDTVNRGNYSKDDRAVRICAFSFLSDTKHHCHPPWLCWSSRQSQRTDFFMDLMRWV